MKFLTVVAVGVLIVAIAWKMVDKNFSLPVHAYNHCENAYRSVYEMLYNHVIDKECPPYREFMKPHLPADDLGFECRLSDVLGWRHYRWFKNHPTAADIPDGWTFTCQKVHVDKRIVWK